MFPNRAGMLLQPLVDLFHLDIGEFESQSHMGTSFLEIPGQISGLLQVVAVEPLITKPLVAVSQKLMGSGTAWIQIHRLFKYSPGLVQLFKVEIGNPQPLEALQLLAGEFFLYGPG